MDCEVGASPSRKKFLVGHCGQKATTMFDYVHLSAKALRNVRHGQPLDHAIQLQHVPSGRARHHNQTAHDTGDPERVIEQQKDEFEHVPNIRAFSATRTSSPVDRGSPRGAASFLRYGRTVRLIADDGGVLLIDSDGSFKKGTPPLASDRRSQLMLFERNPLGVGPTSKSIRAGHDVFLTQGVASVLDDHRVIHADSRTMRSVNTVSDKKRNHSDPDSSRTWRLVKVKAVGDRRLGVVGKSTLQSIEADYFQQGSSLEIRQGEHVVCYEPLEPKSARDTKLPFASSEVSNVSQSTSPVILFTNEENSTRANSIQEVWLAINPPPSLSTKWQVVDVVEEQLQQKRKVLVKPIMQHSLGTKKVPLSAMCTDSNHFGAAKEVSVVLLASQNTERCEIGDLELKDQLDRAARIIVRFLRRICVDEAAKKRITELARTRRQQLHRLTLETLGGSGGDLSTDQQLRILRCYKPQVYAAQPLLVSSLNMPPQHSAARRQMFRNRQRAQLERVARISNEISVLRDTRLQRTFGMRPATSQF